MTSTRSHGRARSTSNTKTNDSSEDYSAAPSSLLLLSPGERSGMTDGDSYQSTRTSSRNAVRQANANNSKSAAQKRASPRSTRQSDSSPSVTSRRTRSIDLVDLITPSVSDPSELHRSVSNSSEAEDGRQSKRRKSDAGTNTDLGIDNKSTEDAFEQEDLAAQSNHSNIFDGLLHERKTLERQINRLEQQQQRTLARIESLLRKHLTTFLLVMYEPDMFVPSFDVNSSEATQLKGKRQIEQEQPEPLKDVKEAVQAHIQFLLTIYKHRSVARPPSEFDDLFVQKDNEEFLHFAERVLASLNDIIPGLRCIKLAQLAASAGVGELSGVMERKNQEVQNLLQKRQEEQAEEASAVPVG